MANRQNAKELCNRGAEYDVRRGNFHSIMTSEQAFEILGIKDRNIDEASLKKAFHNAARKTHPDSNPSDETAKARFHRINEAYEVLCAYLEYEKKHMNSKAFGTQTADEEEDIWKAYEKADIKYARKRHADARKKAEDTIRNHEKLEKEKIEKEKLEKEKRKRQQQEQEELKRREREEEERRRKEEEARILNEKKAQEERLRQEKIVEEEKRRRERLTRFWKQHIEQNKKLKKMVLIGMLFVFLVWIGLGIIGRINGIAQIAIMLAEVAKWILILWMSCKITLTVQKNWQNTILSTFAFLISMELEITLMNWILDLFMVQ